MILGDVCGGMDNKSDDDDKEEDGSYAVALLVDWETRVATGFSILQGFWFVCSSCGILFIQT